jgi:hypothetical protein
VHAEALGFDAAWLAELHFNPMFSVIPAPLLLAAALAQRTTRIRLGTAVLLLPLQHPLRTAEEAAVVDLLSQGRLELGVGRGMITIHFQGFNVPQEEMLLVATSRARDIADGPADSLAVTNSVNNLLPQPASPPAPAAAPPAPSGEESWLSGLHISGYGSQTFGMWQNPTTLRQYTRSRNNLAVARSLLQVDENYRLNENNSFFMREWFVYEPPYSFNSANNPFWAAATRSAGPTAASSANPFCFANTFAGTLRRMDPVSVTI